MKMNKVMPMFAVLAILALAVAVPVAFADQGAAEITGDDSALSVVFAEDEEEEEETPANDAYALSFLVIAIIAIVIALALNFKKD